jgi:S-layer protein
MANVKERLMTDYTSQINAIFQGIEFRAGSAIEVAAYNAGLNSGALTLTSLAALIEQNAYTLNVVNPVIREYQAAFGRVPDQTGLAYWVNEIGANPSALAVLNTTFANSAEFNARYGANATTPANLGLVAELYENVLGRQPDASGLTYWVNSGLNAAQLLQAFAQSPEFVSNTTSAVTAYESLEAAGTPPTAGSLLGLGSTGGQYFTLTTGVDNLSLTANNNTINGTFGSLHATLTAGDSINGGMTAGNVLDLVDLGTGGAGNPTTVGANSISDIQTVNVVSGEAINANTAASTAGFSGLTQLNVTESSNSASSTITAAATTNISVIDQSQKIGGVASVQGGLNISVAVAEVSSITSDSVIVGSSAAPAIGTVAITAAAQPATPGNFQMGSITVYGGTIDSITENEAGSPGFTITGGLVSVYGGATTTSVTVDQTAPATVSAAAAGVVDGAVTIKDINVLGGGSAGVITAISLDGLNGASNIYDSALTNLTVNDSIVGTSVAIVEGAFSKPATILALSLNNDAGLTLNDFGNDYTTVNVTIGAQSSSLTLNDTALTTLTIFGPSGLLGPAGSLVITTNATALSSINAAADTGALTVLTTAAGLTILGGTGGDSLTNWSANGVITEAATAATLHNILAVYGAGATINDQASAGVDQITLGGVNDTANLGSGGTAAASTGVNVSNATLASTIVDTVNFGSGIATVTDHLAYWAAATATSANTNGNLLALAGTLHGEILAFSSSVANTAGELGAAFDVSAAMNLDQAVFLAQSKTANTVSWFQYSGATYIEDSGTNPTANGTAGAELVKITGTVDLSHATIGSGHLTFA